MENADAIDLLFEITHSLLSEHKELAPKFTRALKLLATAGLQRGVVTLHDEDRDELEIVAAHGLNAAQRRRGRYKPGEGIVGDVFRRGRPAIIPNIADELEFLDRTGAHDGLDTSRISFVCVPIATAGGGPVLGTLSGERADVPLDALEPDVRLLRIIAAIMADVVRTWRTHRDEIHGLIEDRRADADGNLQGMPDIIGTSRRMSEVAGLVRSVAATDATVLIRGESGTGKELVARAIHESSRRSTGPFVTVNCGALPENLVEAELFGTIRGAFTGAEKDKLGRFHMADGGTVFLDEIGEVSPAAQVKLLRVLQEREVYRVGSASPEHVDVRIIAATNSDLERSIAANTFREDLFYRLNVFPIALPALRERKSDITLLIDHFVEKHAKLHGRDVRRVSSQAIDLMVSYHWPGNVRELENCLSRAVLLCLDGTIRSHHLPPTLQTGRSSDTALTGSFDDLMAAYEREILIDAMKDAGGVLRRAADNLDTTPRILAYRLKKHGLHSSLVRARRNGRSAAGSSDNDETRGEAAQ